MVERVIITLIQGGHRYESETRAVPANILEFEKFGQAVANGLEWNSAPHSGHPAMIRGSNRPIAI